MASPAPTRQTQRLLGKGPKVRLTLKTLPSWTNAWENSSLRSVLLPQVWMRSVARTCHTSRGVNAFIQLSPLPPPLLPLLTRLNTQMTILTQPRHIDAISRRLKLLLSDLERAHQQQQQPQPHGQLSTPQRKTSIGQSTAASVSTAAGGHSTTPQVLAEQLAPLVTRLAPSLPHIPHLLNRLRTLSALHASAAELEGTLCALEKEQKASRSMLTELSTAIESVETSLEGNRGVVKGNVESLEGRVEELMKRISDLKGGDRDG